MLRAMEPVSAPSRCKMFVCALSQKVSATLEILSQWIFIMVYLQLCTFSDACTHPNIYTEMHL